MCFRNDRSVAGLEPPLVEGEAGAQVVAGFQVRESLPRAATPKRLHTFRPCSSRVRDEHLVDSEGQAAADPQQRRGGQVPEGETGRTKATSNSQEPTSTQSEEDGTLQAAEPGRVRVPQGAPRGDIDLPEVSDPHGPFIFEQQRPWRSDPPLQHISLGLKKQNRLHSALWPL